MFSQAAFLKEFLLFISRSDSDPNVDLFVRFLRLKEQQLCYRKHLSDREHTKNYLKFDHTVHDAYRFFSFVTLHCYLFQKKVVSH